MGIMRIITVSVIVSLLSACGGGSGGGGGGIPTQTALFRIINSCSYAIWVQHTNDPSAINETAKLETGGYVDYNIPNAGRASDRFWAKKGCDANGDNCEIGQSSNPCPAANAAGCAPPVDSKLEATWGCLLANASQCAVNPSDTTQRLTDTYFNTSAVDGYTLPYTVAVSGNTITDAGQPCQNIDCSVMDLSKCPTDENLSQGQTGNYPQYANEDLRVKVAGLDTVLGCYSPCKKLNYASNTGFNGEGLTPDTRDEVVMYCCPTPPISADACRAGPVVNTQYVAAVHNMCTGGVYAYAYDDILGLHHCSASTMITMTFGPNCP